MILALMVVKTCGTIEGGIPGSLYMHMLMNVAIDFVVGLVPFIGDLADALYKCNTKNAVLLERYLKEKGKANMKGQNPALIEAGSGAHNSQGLDSSGYSTPTRPMQAQLPRESTRPATGRSERDRRREFNSGTGRR